MVNRVLEAYKALDLGVLEFFIFSSISFIFGEEEVWAEKGEGGKGFWGDGSGKVTTHAYG